MSAYGQVGAPCPSCGDIPAQRGILIRCCGSRGCTWLRCRACRSFGHPTGRWLGQPREAAPDPHPGLDLDLELLKKQHRMSRRALEQKNAPPEPPNPED